MNKIKSILHYIGWAKYPTTNLYRLKELQSDYEASVKMIAELTLKLEKATQGEPEAAKPKRKRRQAKK